MMTSSLPARLALAMGLVWSALGCAVEAPVGTAAQAAVVTCPGTVTTDARGDPRDPSGHIRYCWPGEAGCFCDRDDDCYADSDYVPCAPPTVGNPTPDAGSGTPTDTGPADTGVVDTGPADTGGTGGGTVGPTLPEFDTATQAHVRDLVTRGAARGNSHDVVAKIGDSITESASFLMDCGHGWYDLGAYGSLASTIQYFSQRTLPGGEGSLSRSSLSATAGWTASDALAGGDPGSPLARELDATRAQWAIVMYGTNDLDRLDVGTYSANLGRVVDGIESRAAVAVLSTIPSRADSSTAASRVPAFNDAVRSLASARHLPLIDYWVGLRPLPRAGLSGDGIHPSILHGSDGCVLTGEGLQYGYNYRNLSALQMLARLRGY